MQRLILSALALGPLVPLAAHAAEGGGMPQLDSSTYVSQIVWLAITFVALYFLIARTALPRIAEVLEARQDRISADLDRAAKLRQEAEEATRRYEQVVLQAESRAQAQIKEVRERVAADAARRQAELDTKLAAQIAEAEARIKAARDSALAGIDEVAAELAQAATRRLIGVEVLAADARAAVQRVSGGRA